MQATYPGVEVSDVVILDEFTTLATKVRFGVTFANAPGSPPSSFFMKGFFGDGAQRAWIGEPEARFFSELAPMLDVRMPRAVYAAVDERNHHGLVILNDLVAEGARVPHRAVAVRP